MSDVNVNISDDVVNIIVGESSVTVEVKDGPGPKGDKGEGVPTGGATGDVLIKTSATDYATAWSAKSVFDERYYTETETNTLLGGKANTSHTHAISDVTSLQTSLDGKAPTNHSHEIADVNNLQPYLDAKVNASEVGSTIATLSSGKVPAEQLPSYVDDVLEYANVAALPGTGEAGKIYITIDTNKTYRWSGSVYVEVSPTIGTTWGGIGGTLSNQTDLNTALGGKVDKNAAITAATKTKITYDSKGLVTAGTDATTADIEDSNNRRYVTDSEKTVVGNTSGTNTGDETQTTIKTKLGAATSSVDGYLTSSDWSTFNAKQAALGYTAENTANKENTTIDTSTTKYPTVNLLKTGLDGKANTSHSHAISDVTNLQTTLDGKAASSHTHAISDVTNLQTSLDAKVTANTSITGATKTKITYDSKGLVTAGTDAAIADITGLQTALDGKQATISLTTTGSSGAATFSSNTLNVPNYTLSGLGGVASTRSLTINGTAYDLSADRTWSVGTVTSVALSAPTGFSVSGSPITSNGTLALSFAAGYSLPTTSSQTNWDAAYNDKINSAAVTGTSTKTLTLTQQDGGTITASWSDIDTDTGITSLNGLTATTQTFATGSGGTDFGISSSASTHTFNLPSASASNRGLLTSTDWSTFNSKEPAVTKGNLTEATSSVLTITGGTGSVIGSGTSIQVKQATGSVSGYLSSTDWTTFNNKQNALTNPVTGTGTTNEIAYFTGSTTLGSLSTATYPSLTELSYVKGVTSAIQTQLNAKEGTLSKGNLTEATSSVLTITGGTNAVIGSGTSIQVKQASGSVSGYLSSTDWTTFNNKQGAITLTTTGTSGAATFSSGTLNIPQYQSVLTNPTTGTGTTNYVAKFTGTSTLGNSLIRDDGTTIGIGTAPISTHKVYVSGSLSTLGDVVLDGTGSVDRTLEMANYAAGTFNVRQSADAGAMKISGGSTSTYQSYINIAGRSNTTPGIQFGVRSAEAMRIVDATANVLIGTATDSGEKLSVAGSGKFTSSVTASSFIKSGGTSSQYLMADGSTSTLTNPTTGTGTSGYVAKWTSSSAVGSSVVYDDGTNVGINEATPTEGKLVINNPNGSTNSGTSGNTLYLKAQTANANLIRFSGAIATDLLVGRFGNADAISIGTTGGTEIARFTSGGNIGIGTTSPNSPLEVYGQTRVSASGGSVLLITPNATSTNGVTIESSYYGTAGYGPMKFNTGGSERLRIFAGGNVYIGSSPSDSGELLQVAGTAKATKFTTSVSTNESTIIAGGIELQSYAVNNSWIGENIYFNGLGFAKRASGYASQIYFTNSGNIDFITYPSGASLGTQVKPLTLANTGAATFSSTVTATAFIPSGSTIPANGMYLSAANTLDFATNTTNRLSISSAGAATFSSTVKSTQFILSDLNTAPASAAATGTKGEIKIDDSYIYICTATNTWKRVAIATW